MDNETIAKKLSDHARLLEKEGNLFRVRAYRQAAQTIRSLDVPVVEFLKQKGIKGLERLPGIGAHLSFVIERLATTGQFHALAAEAESIPSEEKIENLPGVGPKTAEFLWERLGIHSVNQLAQAVHSQQFAALPMGVKRRQRLIDSVQELERKQAAIQPPTDEPTVAELLAVDAEYRRRAADDRLVKIAPGKNDREQPPSLPLLSLRQGGWKYRALFSTTALAHRLGRTADWTVIYFHNDKYKGQRTVVTEDRGDLRGKRVVRGREEECRRYLLS